MQFTARETKLIETLRKEERRWPLARWFVFAMGFVVAWAASLQAAAGATKELTIKSAINFHLEKDPRTWLPQYPLTNETVVTIEWVLKGDSIDSWKELFDEKSMLTKDSIPEHLARWKSLLARVDSKAEVKEEKNADGSITVTYSSKAANEMGISRYCRGNDGIYILSYRVRPKLQNAQIWKIWRDIISTATLAPEHVSKKG
jgi:hypothetical protein